MLNWLQPCGVVFLKTYALEIGDSLRAQRADFRKFRVVLAEIQVFLSGRFGYYLRCFGLIGRGSGQSHKCILPGGRWRLLNAFKSQEGGVSLADASKKEKGRICSDPNRSDFESQYRFFSGCNSQLKKSLRLRRTPLKLADFIEDFCGKSLQTSKLLIGNRLAICDLAMVWVTKSRILSSGVLRWP